MRQIITVEKPEDPEAQTLELRTVSVYKTAHDQEAGLPPLFVIRSMITSIRPEVEINGVEVIYSLKHEGDNL